MDPVNHFEIPAKNKESLQKFYGDVFGWTFTDVPNMNYTMVYTTEVDDKFMAKEPNVINGGMTTDDPAKGTVIVITVPSIDERLSHIKKAGGSVVMEKVQVGDMGFYARATDPDGNLIGIWEVAKK